MHLAEYDAYKDVRCVQADHRREVVYADVSTLTANNLVGCEGQVQTHLEASMAAYAGAATLRYAKPATTDTGSSNPACAAVMLSAPASMCCSQKPQGEGQELVRVPRVAIHAPLQPQKAVR